MNLVPSKVGADRTKVAILGVLVALVAFAYFYNRNSGGGPGSATVASRAPAAGSTAIAPGSIVRSTFRRVEQAGGSTREFRPSLKPKNIDTANIDPTLRLDLLAKLKTVNADAGTRSLFEIAAAPPEEVKLPKELEKIEIARRLIGPVPPKAVVPPPEPKAPPIPLKFYGFVNKTKVGDKRAFFLDGEDIVIASEGDVIKKRYKIVRIGVNSAVVEDTEFKDNNQQTLPLVAELNG